LLSECFEVGKNRTLIITHAGARLQTTAVRNLNLEPKDGQHRLGFRHKLKQSL